MGLEPGSNIILLYHGVILAPSTNPCSHFCKQQTVIATLLLSAYSFANFGSLGIMIGGLTTMAPERREDIIGLGTRSIVSGTLATPCTGAVVGVLY